MENKDSIVFNITKKDKTYLSIIFVLVCVCIVLSIVLPRPYKVVEVEKTVYEKVYQKVYETETLYLISKTSSLYDNGIDGYFDGEHTYNTSFNKNYIDTGSLKQIKVSVKVNNSGVEEQKSITLDRSLMDLIVSNSDFNMFGVEIELNHIVLSSINTSFVSLLGESKNNPLDYYLFEFDFENCIVNYVVSFIGAE